MGDGLSHGHNQKTEELQKAFFPLPPQADFTDIEQALNSYPEAVPYTPVITIHQIRRAIEKSAPNKAPGPDEIPNSVLKRALPKIEWHLRAILQGTLNLGYFPKKLKETTTVVLRKPERPDYTIAKAYRPIALESTIGKTFESIMAEIMSYLTEHYQLLPKTHFGGRPGRSTEDAMMILIENIHRAWKQGKVFTAIYLDVAGAFNNVHHKRLIHNLRARHIPECITKWLESFLKDRSTRMRFNGGTSEAIPTPAGIPQGSPLSPLLYMYYNAGLLEIPEGRDNTIGLGFVDDIVYGVDGATDKGNT